MKTITFAAAALLIAGLTGTAYAKCGGSGMQQGNMQQNGMMMQQGGMMNGNMEHDRAMMMQHLDKVKACVNAAETTEELQNCRMGMQKNAPMMPKQQMMKQSGQKKCAGSN